jgi:hypothetical protein
VVLYIDAQVVINNNTETNLNSAKHVLIFTCYPGLCMHG